MLIPAMPSPPKISTSNRFDALSQDGHTKTRSTTSPPSTRKHEVTTVITLHTHGRTCNDSDEGWKVVDSRQSSPPDCPTPNLLGHILELSRELPKGFIEDLPHQAYDHYFVISQVSGTGDVKVCMITSNRKAKQKKIRIKGSEAERPETEEELVIEGNCPLQLRSWLKVGEQCGICAS
ncbi:hypothetical protein BDP81DRAFT_138628 [Colletotrichum phormii]|uniref:Uncharacterized protein n=1 Tax=Colletotrichum phormii TaxID=359342 RepID=A0AAI9ZEI5_9PEZI|nr:uncharacterized protein BDP81DRAFT_138628 [Colletotrichum phormii]KAK1623078.1 hypothetical protein BDP81DRAFT_138628 [Colletotrichum phormii]